MDHHTADQVADHAATVSQLLGIAELTPSDDELERFVGIYPLLRAQADGLGAAEFAAEESALHFDPTIGFG